MSKKKVSDDNKECYLISVPKRVVKTTKIILLLIASCFLIYVIIWGFLTFSIAVFFNDTKGPPLNKQVVQQVEELFDDNFIFYVTTDHGIVTNWAQSFRADYLLKREGFFSSNEYYSVFPIYFPSMEWPPFNIGVDFSKM